MTYEWNAGDISNIITISSAALASVLMVLFRSRCIRITLCCGLWSCDRVVQEQAELQIRSGSTLPRSVSNGSRRPVREA